MTTITITKSSDDSFKAIECKGHAGFAEYGTDIVCAAVSVLTINLVNSIEKLSSDEIDLIQDEDKGIIRIKFLNQPSYESDILLRSYELGVSQIFQQYGKKFLNIKIRRE